MKDDGAAALVASLRTLVALFSGDHVGVGDVVREVGAVESDFGETTPMSLRPHLTGVRSAYVARHPKTGAAFSLTLDLADGTELTPAAISEAFGPYETVPGGHERPTQFVFHPRQALLAAESAEGAPGRVRRVTLRRR